MMMALGPVVFDFLRVNLQGVEYGRESAFAEHGVMGSAPIYEVTGDGPSETKLTGLLHPEHFGGLGSLAALEAARSSKLPLPLMRGDFPPLGWFMVQSVSQTDSDLNEFGIGMEIQFTVGLLRDRAPTRSMAVPLMRIYS